MIAIPGPYPAVVDRCAVLLHSTELEDQTVLVLDATGVGRAVVDMFFDAHRQDRLGHTWPVPITITGGEHSSGRNITKRDLVSKVQALLQTGELKIAQGLPLADVVTKELLAFRAKISPSGRDTYEAWRESDHDDLVLALCLACWYRHRKSAP